MGRRRAWVLALAVLAIVLAGFWAAPRLVPDLGWGLAELNQVAGIASLAVAVATLVVTLWPAGSTAAGSGTGGGDTGERRTARDQPPSPPRSQDPGRTTWFGAGAAAAITAEEAARIIKDRTRSKTPPPPSGADVPEDEDAGPDPEPGSDAGAF